MFGYTYNHIKEYRTSSVENNETSEMNAELTNISDSSDFWTKFGVLYL